MKNNKWFCQQFQYFHWMIFFVLLFVCGTANAILIEYSLVDNGGNNYTYNYTVTNDGSLGGAAVTGFQIDFDTTLYDELSLVGGAAASWDSMFLYSFSPFFPAQYDACADYSGFGLCDGPGIANGDSLSGFSVSFDWLGAPGSPGPGSQAFAIYDATTFAILEFGDTVLIQAEPVPEPATWLLLLLGVSILGLLSEKHGNRELRFKA